MTDQQFQQHIQALTDISTKQTALGMMLGKCLLLVLAACLLLSVVAFFNAARR